MLIELHRILQAEGTEVSQAELCQRLDVSPETLQSMIDILIRKGKLKEAHAPTCGGTSTCAQKSCPGPEDCELVLIKPVNTITIDRDGDR